VLCTTPNPVDRLARSVGEVVLLSPLAERGNSLAVAQTILWIDLISEISDNHADLIFYCLQKVLASNDCGNQWWSELSMSQ
jgi:hypothetical protein